ncbi:MAG: nucleoside-diphosphate sugar epimerase/dehydratase [Ramlibacter sp.]|uniref:polysaccharide biosynthesis protein n=2 Tax=Comamonadaceae TaxID=80864 RepID=UPI002604521A|nr:nucleoside-diphosphate sugar epimerase/dehydratase [Acidovorax sp.]MDH4377834.1 nucleoside-diphosphate sugar epimerase/dehydratase [Ramlibacter sp.]MDH4465390.1 nucleoside-diphosphate sugar epimerase/dehydratase [Acidovorax sp.]
MLLPRSALLLFAADLVLALAAWWMAFWLRFNLDIPDEFVPLALVASPWCVLGYALGFLSVRVYRQVWSYIGLPELRQLATGIVLGGLLTAAGVLMLRTPNFPRSVLVLQPLIALVLMGAVRAGWRTLAELRLGVRHGKPVLILGSLHEASGALRALKGSTHWQAVGILSPQPGEVGRSLQTVRVLGTSADIGRVAKSMDVHALLMASPPGSQSRRQMLLQVADTGIALLTVPRPDEWLKADGVGPRRLELEDLLGRAPIQLDVAGLADLFSGQTVLVTGAGGSIGSELCRHIARFGAQRLVCVDLSEFAIYQLEQELREAHPQMHGSYYTANVREPERLRAIAIKHRPSVVFHAAAYKHVPLMEYLNEIEAVRTNVAGTLNTARVAGECGARRFVMISTDKAVNPTNVMGASKRLAELMVQGVATEYSQTQYVSVRFGNVLGSSGSVVPLFTRQILSGGPITVTHPDIVRYFMTIPEAAQLVLQAGLMGQSGQIFVLDMGEPVKIVDLAKMMIRLSGKTEHEIPISYTGLRPGEKLYEELLANDETSVATPHPKLRIAKTSSGSDLDIEAVLSWIENAGPEPDTVGLRDWLRSHVLEYKSVH